MISPHLPPFRTPFAIGVDVGGNKIEVQAFGPDWMELARNRVPTPKDYPALLATIAAQVDWARQHCDGDATVGIGVPGVIHPATGLALTANLPASGQPFGRDISDTVGTRVTVLNDARAFALSEAVFGAGRGQSRVMGLVIGTGVGGAFVENGRLTRESGVTGGEVGHMAAPAHLVVENDLPIHACGCGRRGCIETYVAGQGLLGLAAHLTGHTGSIEALVAGRDTDHAKVWQLWCALVAELIHTATLTAAPDLVVLGGGLSRVPDVARDLTQAVARAQLPGFDGVPVVTAQLGDSSGARGAAYASALAEDHD